MPVLCDGVLGRPAECVTPVPGLFLCRSWSNAQGKVEGPWRVPCRLSGVQGYEAALLNRTEFCFHQQGVIPDLIAWDYLSLEQSWLTWVIFSSSKSCLLRKRITDIVRSHRLFHIDRNRSNDSRRRFWKFKINFKVKTNKMDARIVEYVSTGDGSDFSHVQDGSGFSNPCCSQTIGHRGY